MKNIVIMGVFGLLAMAGIASAGQLAPVQAAGANRVIFLGQFSNAGSSDGGEHCSGYSVALWKYDGSFAGMIDYHRGLCGDPPMGVLEDVRYDEKTGKLSFGAKLSTGWDLQNRPTRDVLRFDGVLSENALVGKITWLFDKAPAQETTRVTLRRERTGLYTDHESYDKWLEFTRPIIRFRGYKYRAPS